jgi:hypothetical protein
VGCVFPVAIACLLIYLEVATPNRMYYLVADNESEMKSWMDTLKQTLTIMFTYCVKYWKKIAFPEPHPNKKWRVGIYTSLFDVVLIIICEDIIHKEPLQIKRSFILLACKENL